MRVAVFKATSKAEAGKKLAKLNEEIASKIPLFNSLRVIPILLCIEDLINTVEINSEIERKIGTRLVKDENYLAMSYFINEWYQMLNFMMVEISDRGFYDSSTKIERPEINFGVSIERDYRVDLDKFLEYLRSQGLIGKKYVIRLQERLFLNRFPGALYFIFRHDVSKKIIRNFDKILDLRNLLYMKGLLETMIYPAPEGTEVIFDENGMNIHLPEGFTPEKGYERIGLSQRMIESFIPTAYWNSSFPDVSLETLRKLVEEGKGKTNLRNLQKEADEIYKAFSSMKNYPKTFKKLRGISLQSFLGIVSELIFRCYPEDHTLGIWKLPDLLKDKSLIESYGYENLKKVIELLYDSNKSKNRFDGLIILNDNVFTNFRRLSISRRDILEDCFNEVYEKNLKGKVFEAACRKMLLRKNLKTLPNSVDIFEAVLPSDISYKLWSKQKNRTDIDVIANDDNKLLVIECKDIKQHLLRLREKNQFKKYSVEQYCRVKWISENLPKFIKYVDANKWESLEIDLTKNVYFIPLVVSNILVDIEDSFEGAPIITFTELEEFVSKNWNIENCEKTGELKIKLGSKELSLLWFCRKYT